MTINSPLRSPVGKRRLRPSVGAEWWDAEGKGAVHLVPGLMEIRQMTFKAICVVHLQPRSPTRAQPILSMPWPCLCFERALRSTADVVSSTSGVCGQGVPKKERLVEVKARDDIVCNDHG